VDEEAEKDEFYECDELWNRLGWAYMIETFKGLRGWACEREGILQHQKERQISGILARRVCIVAARMILSQFDASSIPLEFSHISTAIPSRKTPRQ